MQSGKFIDLRSDPSSWIAGFPDPRLLEVTYWYQHDGDGTVNVIAERWCRADHPRFRKGKR